MGNMTNRGGHYVRKTYGPPQPYRSRYRGESTAMDGALGFVTGMILLMGIGGGAAMAVGAAWDKEHQQEAPETTCNEEQLTPNAEQHAMQEEMERSLGSVACKPGLSKE